MAKFKRSKMALNKPTAAANGTAVFEACISSVLHYEWKTVLEILPVFAKRKVRFVRILT